MVKIIYWFALLSVVLLSVGPPCLGSSSGTLAFDARELDAERTSISIVVAGASARAEHMAAGHLVLRVRQGQNDYSFDWGVFDPSKDDFVVDYIRGILDYEHIVRPSYETIRIYRYEGRQLLDYPLHLTTRQKQSIIDELIEWSKPENRVYAYDILYRNCSTVIGGLIIDTLGAHAQAMVAGTAQQSLRHAGLNHFTYFPIIQVFTNIAGGPRADAPATERDLFYLPVRVPESLAKLPRFDDSGEPLSGFLLGEPILILAGDDIPPIELSWTNRLGALTFAVFGGLAILLRQGRLTLRWYLVPMTGYLLMLGSLGCVIVFLRFFSRHSFTWDNRHLLFMWPTDLLLGIVCLSAFAISWRATVSQRIWTFTGIYAAAHLLVGALVLIWNAQFAQIPQDLSAGLALVMPFWSVILLVSLGIPGVINSSS